MITTVKYNLHPLCKAIPEPTAEEKRDLYDDIRKNGLKEPIVLYDGQILDGRSRAEACAHLGIEARYVEWEQLCKDARRGGPAAYVYSKNITRRHLNWTKSQRAMLAAKLISLHEKEAKERQLGGLKRGASRQRKNALRGTTAKPCTAKRRSKWLRRWE